MSYIGRQPVDKVNRVLTEGTLTSTTDTIDVPGGYEINNICVWLNGYRLKTSEFTATDGFTINLGETFPVGTEYIIEEYQNFETQGGYAAEADTNGYIRLPKWLGGFTLQWGTAENVATDSDRDVIFPVEFTTLFQFFVCARALSSPVPGQTVNLFANPLNTTTGRIYNRSTTVTVVWWAIGRVL